MKRGFSDAHSDDSERCFCLILSFCARLHGDSAPAGAGRGLCGHVAAAFVSLKTPHWGVFRALGRPCTLRLRAETAAFVLASTGIPRLRARAGAFRSPLHSSGSRPYVICRRWQHQTYLASPFMGRCPVRQDRAVVLLWETWGWILRPALHDVLGHFIIGHSHEGHTEACSQHYEVTQVCCHIVVIFP